jgi:hypothetical protein
MSHAELFGLDDKLLDAAALINRVDKRIAVKSLSAAAVGGHVHTLQARSQCCCSRLRTRLMILC